ncbi:MAG: ferrochelatase, partial [Myxococcota bacterium]
CHATSRALAAALGLAQGSFSTSFQSRLGRTPWITPHTDVVLPELARAGAKRLAVLCPSFVADCLETVEEIGIRGAEQWRSVGGEALELVPCVNAHPSFVRFIASQVRGLAR